MRALVVVLVGCYSPSPAPGAPCTDDTGCPTGLVCSPASHTCERTATDAPIAPPDSSIDAPGNDARASQFRFRRRLTIKNMTNQPLPEGFTIRVVLGANVGEGGKVLPDFSDLRVIGDTLGERDRIVDPDGPTVGAVTFSLAAALAGGASTSDYALYYGSTTAGVAPANGNAVFQIFDDFTTGIAPTWLVHDAPAVASNGLLVLRANHQDALNSGGNDPIPITSAVEVLARVVDPNSDPVATPDGTFFYWFGYQHTGDFSPSDPWALWIARGKGAVHAEQKSPVGCETECDGPSVPQDSRFHYYVVERDPAATRFSLDGTLSFTATVSNTEDYAVMVRNFMAASDVQIDWVRARTRVTPDPAITVAAEEQLP
jgi:hypothetical protein